MNYRRLFVVQVAKVEEDSPEPVAFWATPAVLHPYFDLQPHLVFEPLIGMARNPYVIGLGVLPLPGRKA